jgi:hypothetical protein
VRLIRPHWKLLSVAFAAMLLQSAADLMEPGPLKVIFDYIIGSKPLPPALARLPLIGSGGDHRERQPFGAAGTRRPVR